MDSKNCLSPLVSEFSGSLGMARKIDAFFSRDRSPQETALLSRKVRDYYKTVLAPRFEAEKAVEAFFERRVGREDPGLQALAENHSTLKKLARNGDADSLYHFGHKLKGYVYFEMDDLFPRIVKNLGDEEREALASKLGKCFRAKPKAA